MLPVLFDVLCILAGGASSPSSGKIESNNMQPVLPSRMAEEKQITIMTYFPTCQGHWDRMVLTLQRVHRGWSKLSA